MAIADRIEYVRLEQLLLDPENPRLPSSLEDRSQDAMLQYIEKTYEPILIGRSIARHGFFVSEPLIVIPRADDKTFTVVEGNRRLVALKLLTDVQARELVGRRRREWERLADQADIPARGARLSRWHHTTRLRPSSGTVTSLESHRTQQAPPARALADDLPSRLCPVGRGGRGRPPSRLRLRLTAVTIAASHRRAIRR